MDQAALDINGQRSKNYPTQRRYWDLFHETYGLTCKLVMEDNKYQKGAKVLDFTFGPGPSGRLRKVAEFLVFVATLPKTQGTLRGVDDMDKVTLLNGGLAECCVLCAAVRDLRCVSTANVIELCIQVVPFCKEEWRAQVREGLLPEDDHLESIPWGTFPQLKAFKSMHTKIFVATKGVYSQTQLAKEGPTDEEALAAIKSFLLEQGHIDSGSGAYLCILRVAADRNGVSKDRRLMDTTIEV